MLPMHPAALRAVPPQPTCPSPPSTLPYLGSPGSCRPTGAGEALQTRLTPRPWGSCCSLCSMRTLGRRGGSTSQPACSPHPTAPSESTPRAQNGAMRLLRHQTKAGVLDVKPRKGGKGQPRSRVSMQSSLWLIFTAPEGNGARSSSKLHSGNLVPCLLWLPGLPWLQWDLGSPVRAAEPEGTLRPLTLFTATKACCDPIWASQKKLGLVWSRALLLRGLRSCSGYVLGALPSTR